MSKSEIIQISIGLLGLFGSWKLTQWWLIIIIALLILLIPVWKLIEKYYNNKQYFKKLKKAYEKLQTLNKDIYNIQNDLESKIIFTDRVYNICISLSDASSGSWLGYHSNIYYKGFETPPQHAFFSPEWGIGRAHRLILEHGSVGNWEKYSEKEVYSQITKRLKETNPDTTFSLEEIQNFVSFSKYSSIKSELLSLITILLSFNLDNFLNTEKDKIENISLKQKQKIILEKRPQSNMSRDSLAVSQGIKTPPHIEVLAEVERFKYCINRIKKLKSSAEGIQKHIKECLNLKK